MITSSVADHRAAAGRLPDHGRSFGRRLGPQRVAWIPVGAVVASWADRDGRRRQRSTTSTLRRATPACRSRSGRGSRPASSTSTFGFFVDNLTAVPADRRHDDRHARARLLDRLHGHDPGRWRFFAYLNLFMFSMLLLVLADNFAAWCSSAWELVGLSSYLLIGFWYRKRTAALAAQEGVHRQPRRRRRLRARDHGDLRRHAALATRPSTSTKSLASLTATLDPRLADPDLDHRAADLRRAPSARAPSSRSTSGCRTRWRARPRCRP